MQRVVLSDHRRGGVVTMGAVLTLTADPGRTKPEVARGPLDDPDHRLRRDCL